MSCRNRNNSVTLLPMRRAQFVRVALCVLASLVAALCMGGYGAQTALYEFVGGGLLVPSLSGSRPNIMVLIAWFAPQAAFCFLFSDVLAGGLGSDAATVLPRVGSRRVWLASKLVHLVLLSAAFSLLGQLANGAVQLVWGCGANMPELIGVVARCAALGFPLTLCLVLAVNCLAIKLEPVVAFAVVEGVYVAGLVGLAYLPRPWPWLRGCLLRRGFLPGTTARDGPRPSRWASRAFRSSRLLRTSARASRLRRWWRFASCAPATSSDGRLSCLVRLW